MSKKIVTIPLYLGRKKENNIVAYTQVYLKDALKFGLGAYRWHLSCRGYAVRYIKSNGKTTAIFMHRVIMKIDNISPKVAVVDHADGDRLNNRSDNLRVCSHRENARNRRVVSQNGFKGVHRIRSKKNPYEARITVNCHEVYLGAYPTAQEAAKAYDEAAKRLHGQYSCTNTDMCLLQPARKKIA